jgi:hypothetical protein
MLSILYFILTALHRHIMPLLKKHEHISNSKNSFNKYYLQKIIDVANPEFNFEHFQSRMAAHKRSGSIPAIHETTGYEFNPELASGPAHHHHQVLYVCRGHCSGPQCDFRHSLKQWHSTVWLGDGSGPEPGGFQSQVVASAPQALEKLDQKRQTLHQLKGVLAQKLEDKQKHKERKLLKNSTKVMQQQQQQQRPASAMMVNRPEKKYLTHERSASAMMVVTKSPTPTALLGK